MDTHHLFKCKGTFVGHAVSSLQHSPTIHTVLSIPHTVLITPTVPLVLSPQHTHTVYLYMCPLYMSTMVAPLVVLFRAQCGHYVWRETCYSVPPPTIPSRWGETFACLVLASFIPLSSLLSPLLSLLHTYIHTFQGSLLLWSSLVLCHCSLL